MMAIFYMHISSPVIGLCINVLTQLLLCRYRKSGLLKSVFIGFFFGLGTVFGLETAYFSMAGTGAADIFGQLLLSTTTYASLGYCYFHFINLGETARRIRIITELWASPAGLTLQQLTERYNAAEIIDARIQRMLRNKQIVQKGGRYYIGRPAMLIMAGILVAMKKIILGKESEFD